MFLKQSPFKCKALIFLIAYIKITIILFFVFKKIKNKHAMYPRQHLMKII